MLAATHASSGVAKDLPQHYLTSKSSLQRTNNLRLYARQCRHQAEDGYYVIRFATCHIDSSAIDVLTAKRLPSLPPPEMMTAATPALRPLHLRFSTPSTEFN